MPETTIMRDSEVGNAWIEEVYRRNPPHMILDASGNPSGNIFSGPVRLAWPELFEAKVGSNGGEPRFGVQVLFTPLHDFTLIRNELNRVNYETFKDAYDPTTQQFYGLEDPLLPQAAKANKLAGYTPGCLYTNAYTYRNPGVFDAQQRPITDRNRVYGGVWAFAAFNVYPSGTKPGPNGKIVKKGARLGLLNVMIIGDDKKFSGGSMPAESTFGGVNVVAPPANPNAQFGSAPAHAAPQGNPFNGPSGQHHVQQAQQSYAQQQAQQSYAQQQAQQQAGGFDMSAFTGG